MSLSKTRLPLGTDASYPRHSTTLSTPHSQELEALESLLKDISSELRTIERTSTSPATSKEERRTFRTADIAINYASTDPSSALKSKSYDMSDTESPSLSATRHDSSGESSMPPTPVKPVVRKRGERERSRQPRDGEGGSGEKTRSDATSSKDGSSRRSGSREERGSEKGTHRSSGDGDEDRDKRRTRSSKEDEHGPGKAGKGERPVKRSAQQEIVRTVLLYLVPAACVIPIALVLGLTRVLLTPLYNSMPLSLHPHIVYLIYFLPPTLAYWRLTSCSSARDLISARVCLGISALGADLVAVGGRRTGSVLAQYLGAQWGALLSLGVLGVGVVGGGLCFALLCFDHIWPVPKATLRNTHAMNLITIGLRSALYLAHVLYAEKACNWAFQHQLATMIQRPEKTILLLSLVMTVLSFFLRPSSSPVTFAQRVQEYYLNRKDLTAASRKKFSNLASRLPRDVYPILITLRLPLLVLILRQEIYLHPIAPYVTADGTLRILHSEQSLTGQIVIAENLRDGYRFMRCDHSILGGRWTRDVPDGKGGTHTDMGDSIFGCFSLQEIGSLAHRSDISDSVGRTLALTTELDISDPVEPEKPEERALIIGLGVGIAAAAFARKGYEVDIVEIDPVVYQTAASHFNLSNYPISTVNLLSGSTYIHHLAELSRQKQPGEDGVPEFTKWSLVVQDCFSGGSVPGEMFTLEFWKDLSELVERDGIVAMNFVGLRGSRASRAVLVTFLSVFEQCRAFSDGSETDAKRTDIRNMVVFCTMTHSPLLTFRPPTAQDVMRSPMRSHVYSTFHPNEIQLDTIIQDSDWSNPDMMLTKDNFANLDKWQIDTALATWKAMSKILTPEMWLAW